MGIGTTLALQAGSMAVNSIGQSAGEYLQRAGDKIFGIDRKKEQLEQQAKLNELQIEGSKNLMDYSRNLHLQTWKDTNYSAQRSEMEKAGLNPAMIYGLSGGGGTTTGNPSGAVQGAHASDEASLRALSIQQQGMALQNAKLSSEIKLTNAQAENIMKQTEKTGSEINKIFEETEVLKNQAWITKIDADFAFQFKTALINEINSNKDVNIQQKDYISKSIDFVSTNIRKIDQEIDNLKVQEKLNNEQINLVKQQVSQIGASILQKWQELKLQGASIDVQRSQINSMVENNIRDNQTKISAGKLQKSGTIMGGVQTIINEAFIKPLFKQDYNDNVMK